MGLYLAHDLPILDRYLNGVTNRVSAAATEVKQSNWLYSANHHILLYFA